MTKIIDLLRQDMAWMNIAEGRPVPVAWSRRRILLCCAGARAGRPVLVCGPGMTGQAQGEGELT